MEGGLKEADFSSTQELSLILWWKVVFFLLLEMFKTNLGLGRRCTRMDRTRENSGVCLGLKLGL